MAIVGCAHLGKSPSPTSAAGSTPRPSETADAPKGGAAAREDAAALPPATSGASHPADNTSVAKAPSRSGGTAQAPKTPSPVKGGSAADKEQPGAAGKAPPTLGLAEIEQRLRDTHAIGVFTKLSLKNQIDDLLGQLRAYHLKQTSVSLPQLRQRYDVLLQKVIGLLQNGDAPLAKDISSSREAIWSLLTNSTTISQL
jgi:hypothetical protein